MGWNEKLKYFLTLQPQMSLKPLSCGNDVSLGQGVKLGIFFVARKKVMSGIFSSHIAKEGIPNSKMENRRLRKKHNSRMGTGVGKRSLARSRPTMLKDEENQTWRVGCGQLTGQFFKHEKNEYRCVTNVSFGTPQKIGAEAEFLSLTTKQKKSRGKLSIKIKKRNLP